MDHFGALLAYTHLENSHILLSEPEAPSRRPDTIITSFHYSNIPLLVG